MCRESDERTVTRKWENRMPQLYANYDKKSKQRPIMTIVVKLTFYKLSMNLKITFSSQNPS